MGVVGPVAGVETRWVVVASATPIAVSPEFGGAAVPPHWAFPEASREHASPSAIYNG